MKQQFGGRPTGLGVDKADWWARARRGFVIGLTLLVALAGCTIEPGLDHLVEGSGDARSAKPQFTLRGELPLSTIEVNELIVFIEEETGRSFLRPPIIVAQSNDDYEAGLAFTDEDFEYFDDTVDSYVRTLQSLGLTDRGSAEVGDAYIELFTSTDLVLGYYDPFVDELYVPTDVFDIEGFTGVLVHELVHALDGQYVDLISPLDAPEDESEAAFSFRALVEGRATEVEYAWYAETGAAPLGSDGDFEALEVVPAAIITELGMAYGFGAEYIRSNGGPSSTWGLLDDPPTSSEQVMVPAATGEPIITIATPEANGPVLLEGVFGAADIFVWLLGTELEPSVAEVSRAVEAADGWAGGQSVLWGDDVESCTRIALAADSDDDRSEMVTIMGQWADEADGRTVTLEGDLVLVTGCAPYLP